MRLGASARTELARRRVWWRDVNVRCVGRRLIVRWFPMPLYGNRADHRRDYDRRRGIGANDETDMRVGHRRTPSAAKVSANRDRPRPRPSLRRGEPAAQDLVAKRKANATDITISGQSSEGAIVGPPRRKTEAGWCGMFHQSIENLWPAA
jgi:hypothetical protein